MLQENKPEIVHISTPGFIVLLAAIYARALNVPIVMSYHTHLPVYAERYLGFIPFIVDISWLVSAWSNASSMFIYVFLSACTHLFCCLKSNLDRALYSGNLRALFWRFAALFWRFARFILEICALYFEPVAVVQCVILRQV